MAIGIFRVFVLLVQLTSACINGTKELPETKGLSIEMKLQC